MANQAEASAALKACHAHTVRAIEMLSGPVDSPSVTWSCAQISGQYDVSCLS